MSQSDQILTYLRKKPLTPLEAVAKFHVMCLAERIRDLREKGHNILTEKVKLPNGKSHAKYHLIKERK
jgi:hypothetical protein